MLGNVITLRIECTYRTIQLNTLFHAPDGTQYRRDFANLREAQAALKHYYQAHGYRVGKYTTTTRHVQGYKVTVAEAAVSTN